MANSVVTDLDIFRFEKNDVRAMVIDGEPWFVGKDLTNILGYTHGARDINAHVADEDKLKSQIRTAGQMRE